MDLLQDENRGSKACSAATWKWQRLTFLLELRQPTEPVKIEERRQEVIDSVDGKEANTKKQQRPLWMWSRKCDGIICAEDTSKEEGDAEAVEEAAEAESDAKGRCDRKLWKVMLLRSEEVTEEVPVQPRK